MRRVLIAGGGGSLQVAAGVRLLDTPAVPEPPTGDPAILGLPIFVVGSIALGLSLVGYVPASAAGAIVPIIFAATGLGLVMAAVWAASPAQSMVACIFGLFAGFWISFALVVLALILRTFGVLDASTGLSTAAGYVVFVFAALGIYLFLGAADVATGGQGLPLGPPLRR
jgi:succinate-acetate transporter protein